MTISISGPVRSKTELAYRRLRQAIVVSEIRPNEPLDEPALMARFEVGRTPLREALKRLALEQFIVWPQQRTPYVRAMTLGDLRKLYETRFLMEVPVCGLAAERATREALRELDAALEGIGDAAAAGDIYRAVEMDYALHSAIASGTQNRFLAEAINNLNCGSLLLWYQAHHQLGLGDAHETHLSLVEAIRRRDRLEAEGLMRQHILTSQRRQQELHLLSGGSDRG